RSTPPLGEVPLGTSFSCDLVSTNAAYTPGTSGGGSGRVSGPHSLLDPGDIMPLASDGMRVPTHREPSPQFDCRKPGQDSPSEGPPQHGRLSGLLVSSAHSVHGASSSHGASIHSQTQRPSPSTLLPPPPTLEPLDLQELMAAQGGHVSFTHFGRVPHREHHVTTKVNRSSPMAARGLDV
ncbi:hypothetical protein KIPB_014054, partial [Kipferlia bialata]